MTNSEVSGIICIENKGGNLLMTIKQLRLLAGLTQKEAARLIGVSPVSLCKWEHGVFKPTPEKIKKIAEVYDVKSSDIEDSLKGDN